MSTKSAFISKRQAELNEKILATIIIVIAAIGIVIPLLYQVGSSFSSKTVIKTVPASILPIEARQVTFDTPELAGKKYNVYDLDLTGEVKKWAYIKKEGTKWVYADITDPSIRIHAKPATPDERSKAIVFNMNNYGDALTASPFPRFILNTLFILVLAVFGTVLSSTLVAYGFSRFYFRASGVLFLVLLATMMLPAQVSLIPSFVVFQKIGWYNTYLPFIVPAFFGSSVWNIFLLRQFFMGLPLELDDAAKIDGCGPLRTLFYVILPQCAPVLITITLMSGIWWWNEYFYSVIYLQDKNLYTVAMGLATFDSLYYNNSALKAAAVTMMAIPPIAVFFFFQRYFIQGTVVSGVKG